MGFAPAWLPSAAAGCWRTAAPKAASGCLPEDRRPKRALSPTAAVANVSQPLPSLVPPADRLKRRAEFLRVAAKGRKAAAHGLVLQALNREDQGPVRIGFTVTKKIGNAVVRNRTRRRLKEAARLELAGQQIGGADLVLIGREATRGREFLELRDDFRRALRKVGIGFEGQAP
jgi:ribonuclease P protein component